MYATQTGVAPPTFVFFTNVATSFHFSYTRFLENRLREAFGFEGTPIRMHVRAKRKGGGREGESKGSKGSEGSRGSKGSRGSRGSKSAEGAAGSRKSSKKKGSKGLGGAKRVRRPGPKRPAKKR
jgi:hypothetical protein